jgi:hypothetical protein
MSINNMQSALTWINADGCFASRSASRSTAMAALPTTKMAHQHGASREEIAETVALAMGGGVRRGRAARLRSVCRQKP